MIFLLIGGVLLAVFSGGILLHAIPKGSHHYAIPRPADADHPRIFGVHVVVSAAWSIAGLMVGLCLIVLYFIL